MNRRAFAAPLVALLALSVAPRPASSAGPVQDDEGFVPLFNGEDLSGWQGATDGYAVEDGVLYCKAGSGGKLYTGDEYEDFVLRFDFKLTPGANNGIGLRAPTEGDPAFAAMEIQILDDTAEKYSGLQPYQYHGSVYGIVPAKKGHLKPVGEWNSQEISCIGRHVTVVLNGETIVDADLDEASEGGTMDGRDHPGLERSTGYIALLGHGDRVDFRDIRVKVIDDSAP
ncbi:3-keto-disaccharide hydrolase [Tautonia plasticadhaerens]|uniref:3-keto-alpha-glucoside-1,2-lyase/3-keto-2-hydroxy-glucal hydratase domain-containing protein n=1 Tax=Tautonia plasticadhaerens TaxID=2527974 RepID=A0A518H7J3_9BACT|nr:DUF1080 domain-containing protein [Tautonia plasticadhaerens]QDV36838.1 hypothetical protein ElP_47670 [Tautonia plasticadhaerens]